MKINNDALYDSIPVVANQEGDLKNSQFSDLTKKLMWYAFPQINHNSTIASFDQTMLFMVKVYSFLAGMILSLYLMIVILYFCDDFRWSLIQIVEFQEKHYSFYQTQATIFYWINMMFTICLGFIINIFKSTREVFNFIKLVSVQYHFLHSIFILYTPSIRSSYCKQFKYAQIRIHHNLIFILYDDWNIYMYYYFYIQKTYPRQIKLHTSSDFYCYDFFANYFYFYHEIFYRSVNWGAICHVIYSFLMLFEAQMIMHGKFLLKTIEFIIGALLFYIDMTVFILYLSVVASVALVIGICLALCSACAHIK